MQTTREAPTDQRSPLAWQCLAEFSLAKPSPAKSSPSHTLFEAEIAAKLRAGGLLSVFQALGVPICEFERLVRKLAQAVRGPLDQPGSEAGQPVVTIRLFYQGRSIGEFQQATASNLCGAEALPGTTPQLSEATGPDQGGWGYFVIGRETHEVEKAIELYMYREGGSHEGKAGATSKRLQIF